MIFFNVVKNTFIVSIILFSFVLISCKKKKYTIYNKEYFGTNFIRTVKNINNEYLLVGTFGNGLYKFSPIKKNISKVKVIPNNSYILSVKCYKNTIYAGTAKNGLYIFNKNLKLIKHIKNEKKELNVWNLYKNADTIVICSRYGKILYLINDTLIEPDLNIKNKLREITLFKTDKKANKYIGTAKNGLIKIDNQNKPFFYYNITKSKYIRDIEFLDSSNFLLATWDNGLYIIKHNRAKLIKKIQPPVTIIKQYSPEIYIIGTWGNGLWYIDTKKQSVNKLNNIPIDSYIIDIEYFANKIFIATNRGLIEISQKFQ